MSKYLWVKAKKEEMEKCIPDAIKRLESGDGYGLSGYDEFVEVIESMAEKLHTKVASLH